jgi:hypothetical protein
MPHTGVVHHALGKLNFCHGVLRIRGLRNPTEFLRSIRVEIAISTAHRAKRNVKIYPE